MVEPLEPDAPHPKPASFVLHWEPIDPGREAEPMSPDQELRKAYGDRRG
jgi:hypothetical protein